MILVVVDTNIVFSAILSPEGTISDLLLNSSIHFQYYSPSSLIEELNNNRKKIIRISGYSEEDLDFLIRTLLRKIELIDLESIRKSTWEKAVNLVEDIDEFDAPFIALSMELEAVLWTGDKKLNKGLKEKQVNWILDTTQIKGIRDKLDESG